MPAETLGGRTLAAFCLLPNVEESIAAKPTAELDAQWGSPDHMLFLPVVYAELSERN